MMSLKVVVLFMFVLAGCEVAGQLTIFDDGQYKLSIGEVSDTPASDLYPDSGSSGFALQLKRRF